MRAVISEKGQVTIPKALRDSLGLQPGQELEFEELAGALVARRVHRSDPLQDLLGLFAEPRDVDAFLVETRGPGLDDDHGR
jgi:antitoxin PrlF